MAEWFEWLAEQGFAAEVDGDWQGTEFAVRWFAGLLEWDLEELST